MNIAKLVTRDEFITLNKKSIFYPSLHIFIRLFLIVFFLSLSDVFWREGQYIFFLLVAYVHCVSITFWGFAGLAHEFSHASVFKNKVVNKYLFILCSSVVFENYSYFKLSHVHHHVDTFADDDHEAIGLNNWSITDIFSYSFLDIRALLRKYRYALVNSFGFDGKSYERIDQTHVSSARTIVVLNMTFHLILWFLFENWIINILWFIGPFTGTFLNKFLARAQHLGLGSHKNDGALLHSRTLLLPLPLSFLYANMNYHVEHHLAPSIPYYNLPKLHRILKSKGLITPESNTNYIKNTFIPYVWSESKRAA